MDTTPIELQSDDSDDDCVITDCVVPKKVTDSKIAVEEENNPDDDDVIFVSKSNVFEEVDFGELYKIYHDSDVGKEEDEEKVECGDDNLDDDTAKPGTSYDKSPPGSPLVAAKTDISFTTSPASSAPNSPLGGAAISVGDSDSEKDELLSTPLPETENRCILGNTCFPDLGDKAQNGVGNNQSGTNVMTTIDTATIPMTTIAHEDLNAAMLVAPSEEYKVVMTEPTKMKIRKQISEPSTSEEVPDKRERRMSQTDVKPVLKKLKFKLKPKKTVSNQADEPPPKKLRFKVPKMSVSNKLGDEPPPKMVQFKLPKTSVSSSSSDSLETVISNFFNIKNSLPKTSSTVSQSDKPVSSKAHDSSSAGPSKATSSSSSSSDHINLLIDEISAVIEGKPSGSLSSSSSSLSSSSSSSSPSLSFPSSSTYLSQPHASTSSHNTAMLCQPSTSTGAALYTPLPGTSDDNNNCAVHGSLSERPLSTSSSSYPEKLLRKIKKFVCSGCKKSLEGQTKAACTQGHFWCKECMKDRVIKLFTKTEKGSLKCSVNDCGSFFLKDQLKEVLPAMMVEILETKFDKEYMDYMTYMHTKYVEGKLSQDATSNSSPTPSPKSDCSCSQQSAAPEPSTSSDNNDSKATEAVKNIVEELNALPQPGDTIQTPAPPIVTPPSSTGGVPGAVPETWENMEDCGSYKLVELDEESEEYLSMAILFHDTMYYPLAEIVSVKRVQNTSLWQFYNVKKRQMKEENDNMPVLEKQLFHGTSRKVIEAICRSNFDWRMCGTHGVVFGQGSYFAKDASYSHKFTGASPPIAGPSAQPLFSAAMAGRNLGFHNYSLPQPPPLLQPLNLSFNAAGGGRTTTISSTNPSNTASSSSSVSGVSRWPWSRLSGSASTQHQRNTRILNGLMPLPSSLLNPGSGYTTTSIILPNGQPYYTTVPAGGTSSLPSILSAAIQGGTTGINPNPNPIPLTSGQQRNTNDPRLQQGNNGSSRYSAGSGSGSTSAAAAPQQMLNRAPNGELLISSLISGSNSKGVNSNGHPLPSSSSSSSSTQASSTANDHLLKLLNYGPPPQSSNSGRNNSAGDNNTVSSSSGGGTSRPAYVNGNGQSVGGGGSAATSNGAASAADPTGTLNSNSFAPPSSSVPHLPFTSSAVGASSAAASAGGGLISIYGGVRGGRHSAAHRRKQILKRTIMGTIKRYKALATQPHLQPVPTTMQMPDAGAEKKTRFMFVAKVLVGRYTGGRKQYRKPPPLYEDSPYGKCYDSCVDNITKPTIFVIFDNSQCYPEYVIEYKINN